MSSQTPNLNLVLPVGTEHVSRQIINDNNTKIDTAVGANSTAIAKLNYVATLNSTNDLNSISDGTYWCEANSLPANVPSISTNVNATVQQITFANGNEKYQFYVAALSGVVHTYQRRYFTTWGAWTELATTNVSSFATLLETGSLSASTVQSYSCNWSDYKLLIIQRKFYANILETIVVDTSFFSGTSSGTRVLLEGGKYEVYKNGNNTVYVGTGADIGSNRSIKIVGVMKI